MTVIDTDSGMVEDAARIMRDNGAADVEAHEEYVGTTEPEVKRWGCHVQPYSCGPKGKAGHHKTGIVQKGKKDEVSNEVIPERWNGHRLVRAWLPCLA